jgi:hypothetical protein
MPRVRSPVVPSVEPAGFQAFRVTLTEVEYTALRRTKRVPLRAKSSKMAEMIAEELSRVLTEDLADRLQE